MKTLRLLSLVGITSIALANAGWAHGGGGGGGGGGFGGGGGGGHGGGGGGPRGGGVASRGGGVGFGRPGFSGMRFTNSRAGQFHSPVHRSSSFTMADRGMANSMARQSRTSGRNAFNRGMNHIAERHDANWHSDWDRRHAHFFHNRFFVFDDGFWFGLDPGFYPWDYLPYYADDYYPYDYYADSQPYDNTDYYNNGVPAADPTVEATQEELAQHGYYNGPVDGIFV